MNEWWLALLGTGSASALAGAGMSAIFGRRKIAAEVRETDAHTAEILVNAAATMILPLKEQIAELTARVAALEEENTQLKEHIRTLEGE